MTPASDDRPADAPASAAGPRWTTTLRRRLSPTASDRHRVPRHPLWRVATPLVVMFSGGLFVTSALSSDGTDLRPGRYTDLTSLVEAQKADSDRLSDQRETLQEDVRRLSTGVANRETRSIDQRAARLESPAGLAPVSGKGISVTLTDAPDSVQAGPDKNVNLLVVHQQDIQAVVNAMWRAGAEAVVIQGQRIVSTTGIKCEGNAVTLHGIPYAQPYVIEAVGDPAKLKSEIDSDAYLDVYREQADNPQIAIGWQMQVGQRVEAPAYDGLLDFQYAKPIDG